MADVSSTPSARHVTPSALPSPIAAAKGYSELAAWPLDWTNDLSILSFVRGGFFTRASEDIRVGKSARFQFGFAPDPDRIAEI
jgi:hypothetical protein